MRNIYTSCRCSSERCTAAQRCTAAGDLSMRRDATRPLKRCTEKSILPHSPGETGRDRKPGRVGGIDHDLVGHGGYHRTLVQGRWRMLTSHLSDTGPKDPKGSFMVIPAYSSGKIALKVRTGVHSSVDYSVDYLLYSCEMLSIEVCPVTSRVLTRT